MLDERRSQRSPAAARHALWLSLVALAGCVSDAPSDDPRHEELGRCSDFNPLRNPYFGDTHAHSTFSLDANVQNTRLLPADAYRFARGEEVGIQPYSSGGEPLRRLRLDRPLDFVAMSDHAEFLSTVAICSTPELPGYEHDECDDYRDDPFNTFININALLALEPTETHYPELCGASGEGCLEQQREVWREIQDAAEDAYDREATCSFTTFIGYEWSPSPNVQNLHRNVIFRNHIVPDRPAGYFDAPTVEALWDALDRDCLQNDSGCDALTIPHNSNLSGGLLFDDLDSFGEPFTAEYAARRESMEPLAEIFQHKGDAECRADDPTGDELCGFEDIPYNNLAGPVMGFFGEASPHDFLRDALGRGLRHFTELGGNPFHYGFLASTDTHLATPGAVSERGYPGHGGAGLASTDILPPGLTDVVEFNPGGLAVLWAEENSREALYQAMLRRETYGTSGPRITLRFFGGWELPDQICESAELARLGYENGVPMGGTLGPAPGNEARPSFVVQALADPGTDAQPGTPLQRAQIVKGWHEDGEVRVTVHDVAGDPENGATVDPATCETSGQGSEQLCAVWTDADFDPGQHVYYYVRVVENPTCRWATHQCNAGGVDCQDPTTIGEGYEPCCRDTWERTIQERAWSSPIWYVP